MPPHMLSTSPLHDGMPPRHPPQDHQKNPSSGNAPVSARKLASSFYQGPMANKAPPLPQHQFHLHSNGDQSSPSSSASRRMSRRISIQHKLADGARRQTLPIMQSSLPVAGPHEKQTGVAPKQIPTQSNIEGQAYNAAVSSSKSDVNLKGLPRDLGGYPRTSSELLKVLNRIWNLEEQNTSSTSLVSTLRVELDNAHAKLQELMNVQKLYHTEIDSLTKRLADERAMWKEQEQEKVRITLHSLKSELEEERKSKQRLEMLYKKAVQDLTEMKATLGKTLNELQREKKARELMEEVCDELAREIGKDKAEVAELKRESAKVREEVEEERKMLELAEVWREERVQMKLAEARLELEERNSAVNKLRSELESFHKAKRACDAKNEGSCFMDRNMEMHGSSVGSLGLQEAQTTDPNSDAEFSEVRYHIEPSIVSKVRGAAPAVPLYDEVSESGNVQGREKARSHYFKQGINIVESKGKTDKQDYLTDSQWIDRCVESGEMKEWCQDRCLGVANNDMNNLWHSSQDDSEGHIIFDARTLGRHLQGHTDTIVGDGSVSVEGTNFRSTTDANCDSHTQNYVSRLRDAETTRISQTNSGLGLLCQSLNVESRSSPTREWNHYRSSPDPASSLGGTGNISIDMSKVARNSSLKARLLEAKLEGQQVRLRDAKGL